MGTKLLDDTIKAGRDPRKAMPEIKIGKRNKATGVLWALIATVKEQEKRIAKLEAKVGH